MDLKLFIEIGMFVIAIGGIVYNVGKTIGQGESLNTKIDQHIKDNDTDFTSIKSQLQRQWDWKDSHEREASNMRLELQKQIGKVEASISIHDGQYAEILRMIQSNAKDVTDKIDKLESLIENLRNNK